MVPSRDYFLNGAPVEHLNFNPNDVKSRSAGAGFEPAAYGFVARTPSFRISSHYSKLLILFNPILSHFSRFYTIYQGLENFSHTKSHTE